MKWIPVLKNQKIVFCDWYWVDPGYGRVWSRYYDEVHSEHMAQNLKIIQRCPTISEEPIITHEFPWEEDFFGPYLCVVEMEDKLHLYYECFPSRDGKVHDKDSIMCLAQSEDGKKWTKPKLVLFPWNENFPETNIIYRPPENPHGVGAHGIGIFIDPLASSSDKYKLLYEGKNKFVCALSSADGIHWKDYNDGQPIIQTHADSQSCVFYDYRREKYVGFFRKHYMNKRMIGRSETNDFSDWPEPILIINSDPNRPVEDDYYTNAFQPWPGIPYGRTESATETTNESDHPKFIMKPADEEIYIMFPSIYHRHENHVDSEFWISRTGFQWHRFKEQVVPVDSPGMSYFGKGSWVEFDGMRKLRMFNFPLMLYDLNHGEQKPAGGNFGTIHTATWGEDRFCGISNLKSEQTSEFWTPVIHVNSKFIFLNAIINKRGNLEVELWDDYINKSIPGFSFTDFDQMSGDVAFERLVWNGDGDVSCFDDVNLRVHFRFSRATIFSLRFFDKESRS